MTNAVKAGAVPAHICFEGSVPNPARQGVRLGLADDPVGLRYLPCEPYERYQKPLFIVENGFGADDTVEEDGSTHTIASTTCGALRGRDDEGDRDGGI